MPASRGAGDDHESTRASARSLPATNTATGRNQWALSARWLFSTIIGRCLLAPTTIRPIWRVYTGVSACGWRLVKLQSAENQWIGVMLSSKEDPPPGYAARRPR